MVKQAAYSRDNYLNPHGNLDFCLDRLDQHVLRKSDVLFNSIEITTTLETGSDVNIGGSLIVQNDLTVLGNTTVISTDVTEIKDNIILINSEETGSGVTPNLSGIEVERGTLINFQSVFDETNDLFMIGFVGNLQPVLTRELAPLDAGIFVYNETLGRADSTQDITLPITFSANITATDSSTGTIRNVGDMAVTQDIYLDGILKLQGQAGNYTNTIDADSGNNLLLNANNDLYFNLTASKNIRVPANVNVLYGTNTTTSSDNTHYYIANTNGNINLSTIASGSVTLPTNTYLEWNPTNRIRYNGTNLILDASNTFTINPIISSTNTTTSSSINSGSILVAGSIAISNTAEGTSSSSGGTFTSGGSGAFAKTLYIGRNAIVGDTNITTTQVANQGVNFRSLSRVLTTTSNNNVTFNSFEGSSISTASTIANASTVFITSEPTISGGGGAITNSYALYVNSGNVRFPGKIFSSDSTASASYTTGTLIMDGSIAISNITNAVNVNNGGGITSRSGYAFLGDGYMGGKLDIANTDVSITQIANQGINLRSRSRTLTTGSANNTTFNSFEGGTINSSATIPIASTLYISSAPTIAGGGSIGSAYNLYAENGLSRFDKLYVASTNNNVSSSQGDALFGCGISISNTQDASGYTGISSLSSAGGSAFAKSVRAGLGYYSNAGISSHLSMQTGALNRFTLSLSNTESGSNVGADFNISRYDDSGVLLGNVMSIKRDTGAMTISGNISSTSSTIGLLKLSNGGFSIDHAVNATSFTNGGSFTTSGGGAFGMDVYINGSIYGNTNLTIENGISSLGQTNINTNNGSFSVSGSNAYTLTSSAASSIKTSAGSLTLDSEAGSLILDGNNAITITSDTGAVNTTANANSTVNVTGTYTINASSNILIDSASGYLNLESAAGGMSLQTTGIMNIATDNNSINVNIGDGASSILLDGSVISTGDFTVLGTTTTLDSTLVTINNIAFVVNNMPTGFSDGGFLIHRWQEPNDTAQGDVITDTPKESSTFQTGSALPNIVILNATASAVNDAYKGWWILVTSGLGINQTRRIKSYNGTTKEAILYDTSDNTVDPPYFEDGLDLTIAPAAGDAYELFDIPYAGVYYSSADKEIRFAGVAFDPVSGTFGTPTSYLNLHANSLVIEESFTSDGDTFFTGKLSVKNTNVDAIVFGKHADDGNHNTFVFDTTNSNTYQINPTNTIGTSTTLFMQGFNNINANETYSSIESKILNNVSGNIIGQLTFSVANDTSGFDEFIKLTGSASQSVVDFTNNVDAIRIQNITSSTSSTTGGLILNCGLSSNLGVDATSPTNGGTFTLDGGFGMTGKFYNANGVFTTSTNSVATNSNTISGTQGAINSNGDILLYNGTKQGIYFSANGSAVPAFTNRASGTKLILKPNISGSTVDSSIGISSNALWYAVDDSTYVHDFYLGITKYTSISSTGISLPVNNTGLNLSSNARIYQNSNITKFIPQSTSSGEGFIFMDSTDTSQNIRINSDGRLSLSLSNISGTPSKLGNVLNVNSITYTDNDTLSSQTIIWNSMNTFNQHTLAATNSSVTTTNAINTLFNGPIIQGTNETLSNTYNIYAAIGNSLSSGANIPFAANVYIEGEPIGNIDNAYALVIGSGKSNINGIIQHTSSTQVSTSTNTIINTSGNFNTNGDITLYNGTKQSIYFAASGSAIPTFTNRSSGSKIILKPSIGVSSADHAFGISTNATWYSVPDSAATHDFYFGTTKRLSLSASGAEFNNTSTVLKNTTDSQTITLAGGSLANIANGSYITLYGESSSSDILLAAGTSGKITYAVNGTNSMQILNNGTIRVLSTTDTTGSTTGALSIDGGAYIEKTAMIGTTLALDFNQRYDYTGNVSGHIDIQSQLSGINSRYRHFTKDGDNTDDNITELYGLGTPLALTDSEYLKVGYQTSSTNYIISTNATGTGSVRNLILQTGANTGQVQINSDGTFVSTGISSFTDATNSSSPSTGAVVIENGGLGVAQDIYAGGSVYAASFSGGVTTPSITFSNLSNITGSVTANNVKLIRNGDEAQLRVAFTFTPTTATSSTSFDFTVPSMVTNFSNAYDIIPTVNGYHSGTFINIENTVVYAKTSTTTAAIKCTAGSTNTHTLNVTLHYTIL